MRSSGMPRGVYGKARPGQSPSSSPSKVMSLITLAPTREDLKVWGRHDAGRHATRQRRCFSQGLKMVLSQSLGYAARSSSQRQEGDRRLGTTPRRHPAPDVDRRHPIPMAQGGQCGSLKDIEFRPGGAPLADDGRCEFATNVGPPWQGDVQIVPPRLLTPSCGANSADLGEKRVPRETACNSLSERKISDEGLDTAPPR
jgi:hypothetical protein